MMRMSQRINRSQRSFDKEKEEFEGSQKAKSQIQPDVNQVSNAQGDNPIVALEPENLNKESSVQ